MMEEKRKTRGDVESVDIYIEDTVHGPVSLDDSRES